MLLEGHAIPTDVGIAFWVIFEGLNQKLIIHVNPERSFGGTNGEPPSEASQLRKGGKFKKTSIANGAIYVIPKLYL